MIRNVRCGWLVALGCFVFLLSGMASPLIAESPHLKMGIPSKATDDPSNKNDLLMEKEYFALSYNNSKGTPNWVSWRLTKDDLGDVPRFQFHPDEDLPEGFVRVLPKDYVRSGFDRGHMCPHGDRTADQDMSEATFVMTNMVPQSPRVNQKAWNQLEIYCRDLVENQHKKLYIVAGPLGMGGTGKNGMKKTLAGDKVTVPKECWKIIMVLRDGDGDDLAMVNSQTRLIAVIMPNDMSVGDDWSDFRVSVKEIEEKTRYTFFDKAPAEVIGPKKEKVDERDIPAPVPVRRAR